MKNLDNIEHLRKTILPSFDQEETDPYAVVMVLKGVKDEEGNYPSEQDIFQAESSALTQLLLTEDENVRVLLRAWMEGRIRKLMKRVKPAAWKSIISNELFHTVGVSGSAEVAVFAPVRISEQPDALRKAQVAGLEAPVNGSAERQGTAYLHVYADASLNMTTGKLAAQVGHAVQLFLMYGNTYKIEEWMEAGCLITVERSDNMPSVETADIIVRDAGFTEVPSGSVTVAALYRK